MESNVAPADGVFAARHENPFCAARLRPGTMPFLVSAGRTPENLLDRLKLAGWWGEITGPHGSGKSSLLAVLASLAEQSGRRVLRAELHDGQRRLPEGFWAEATGSNKLQKVLLVAVDGYEQLGRWNRFRLKRTCGRRGSGLLVTAHEPMGLPPLCRTAVDAALALRVVEQLQAGYRPLIRLDDVVERLASNSGNLREALFDLYDLYEHRARHAHVL